MGGVSGIGGGETGMQTIEISVEVAEKLSQKPKPPGGRPAEVAADVWR